MKLKKLLLIPCAGAIFLISSCIKEEGMDREADVISVSIDNDKFISPIVQEGTRQIFLIAEDTTGYHNGQITPTFEISPNSTIYPASGETVQLNNYRADYLVTAEDGTKKYYSLVVMLPKPLIMDFEGWFTPPGSTNKKEYELPTDPDWVNANEGVKMLYAENKPFPTRKSTDTRPGSDGTYSVLLETVKGNSSSVNIMNIPVFAGNMFRGIFDPATAMKDPLSTTHFGQPLPKYEGKPIMLKTWYKYKAGSEFTNWKYSTSSSTTKEIFIDPTRVDKPDMYAIIYKLNKNNNFYLDGHTIKSSDKIVATAIFKEPKEGYSETWKQIEIPFVYKEELNYDRDGYKLAIVLSSSEEGADYRGAVGSILYVDDLEVVCEY